MLQFLATSTPFFAVIALGALVSGRSLFGPEAVRVLNTFAFMIETDSGPIAAAIVASTALAALTFPFALWLISG